MLLHQLSTVLVEAKARSIANEELTHGQMIPRLEWAELDGLCLLPVEVIQLLNWRKTWSIKSTNISRFICRFLRANETSEHEAGIGRRSRSLQQLKMSKGRVPYNLGSCLNNRNSNKNKQKKYICIIG